MTILLELSRPVLVRTNSYRTTNFNGIHNHLPYVHTLQVYCTIEDYHPADVRSSFKRMIVARNAKWYFHTSNV